MIKPFPCFKLNKINIRIKLNAKAMSRTGCPRRKPTQAKICKATFVHGKILQQKFFAPVLVHIITDISLIIVQLRLNIIQTPAVMMCLLSEQ